MPQPRRLSTADTIIQFLADNPEEFSAAQIGEGVFLKTSTVRQAVLFLTQKGILTRRPMPKPLRKGRSLEYIYRLKEIKEEGA